MKMAGASLFYAGSAYRGAPRETIVETRGIKSQVCDKGVKNRPFPHVESFFEENRENICSIKKMYLSLQF